MLSWLRFKTPSTEYTRTRGQTGPTEEVLLHSVTAWPFKVTIVRSSGWKKMLGKRIEKKEKNCLYRWFLSELWPQLHSVIPWSRRHQSQVDSAKIWYALFVINGGTVIFFFNNRSHILYFQYSWETLVGYYRVALVLLKTTRRSIFSLCLHKRL